MNTRAYGLITVRTNSTRLKSKCLLKFGKINVLTHVIKRAKKFNIIPIICTTKNKSDNIIEKISRIEKIRLFRGSEKNKIKRWHDCSKKFNIKYFHTIDGDDPFFDPITIKRSLNLCKKGFDVVYPSIVSQAGGASEGWSFSSKAIRKIYKNLFKYRKKIENFDTEMIETFIKAANLKTHVLSGAKYELKNARLTLDYKEDYKFLLRILDKKGNFASRKEINSFLKKNKHLLKINLKKQLDWKKRQASFKTQTIRQNV